MSKFSLRLFKSITRSYSAIANESTTSLPRSQVLKVHSNRSPCDRLQPWQNLANRQTVGSGFLIKDRKIVTNAHVVANHVMVTVSKFNSGTHFHARVSAIGHECDLALLEIDDPKFWDDPSLINESLDFSGLPNIQDTVTVLGYPTGGDSLSVTRGVVSRLEIGTYIHSATQLLLTQIDASINPGNSGGPCIAGDVNSLNNENGHKVIGVAFQNLTEAENVGYIIPSPIVNHFLTDIEKFGEYRGFCTLGINFQTLPGSYPNLPFHDYFQLDRNKTGILVTKVHKHTPADNYLQPYDIVTHIDGIEICNDGQTNWPDRPHETVGLEYWISNKFDGDYIELKVWRSGKLVDVRFQLWVSKFLVPIQTFEKSTPYYIFGGCAFIQLTQPYLHTWGDEWYQSCPRDLMTAAMAGDVPNEEKEQIIVMSSVLPHQCNMGAHRHCNIILQKVGDEKVKSLSHLKTIIEGKSLKGELISFEFKHDRLLVLNSKDAIESESVILRRHRVSHRQSSDLDDFNVNEFETMMDGIDSGVTLNSSMISTISEYESELESDSEEMTDIATEHSNDSVDHSISVAADMKRAVDDLWLRNLSDQCLKEEINLEKQRISGLSNTEQENN